MELLLALAFLTLYVTFSSLQCRLLNVTYNVKKAITPMRSRHIWPRPPLIIHVSRQIPGSKITGVYQLGFPDFFLDTPGDYRRSWPMQCVCCRRIGVELIASRKNWRDTRERKMLPATSIASCGFYSMLYLRLCARSCPKPCAAFNHKLMHTEATHDVRVPIDPGNADEKWDYMEIPMYDPNEILSYLWESAGVHVDPEDVKHFWGEAEKANVPWAVNALGPNHKERIPLKIFGDEATYNKLGDQCLGIVLSCPLWCPKVSRPSR